MANRQPREVSLERFDVTGRTSADLPKVPGPAADSLSASIKAFEGLSSYLNAAADKAAIRDGTEAGATAALQQGDNLQLRRDGTLSGEAFDRAATDVRAAQIDTQMRNDIFNASEHFKGNPDGLTQKLTELRGKLQEQSMGSPTMLANLEKRFDDLRFPYEKAAIRERDTNLRNEAIASYGTAIETATTDAKRAAYIFGGDPDGDEKLAKESRRIKGMIANAQEAGYITPAAAARATRTLDGELEQEKVAGTFDRLASVDQKLKFLDEMDKGYRAGSVLKTLDPDEYDKLYRKLDANLRREQAVVRQDARQLSIGLSSIKDRAMTGYSVSPGEWAELDSLAKRSGSTETQAALQKGKTEAARIDQWWTMKPADLAAGIAAEKSRLGGKATAEEAARLGDAEAVYASLSKQAKDDPLGLAERTGRAAPTSLSAAVITGEPAAMAPAFTARKAAAEQAAAELGVTPKYFLPHERGEWAKVLNAGGEGAVAAATMLTQHWGQDAALKAIAEIAPDAAVMAQAAAVKASGGSSAFTADVARSLSYAQMQGYEPLKLKSAQVNAAIADEYGAAFSAAPAAAARAGEAAKAAFDARGRDQRLSGEINSGNSRTVFRRTLQEAAGAVFDDGVQYGGVATINGRKTLIPSDIRASRAGDVIAAIKDDDLTANQPFGTDGKPMKAADLRSASFVAVGPGRYRVARGDPDGDRPQWVANKDGSPYVLDLNALATTLRNRRPDLYRGAGGNADRGWFSWMGR